VRSFYNYLAQRRAVAGSPAAGDLFCKVVFTM